MMRKRSYGLAVALSASAVVACSLITDVGEQQCASDGDCSARGQRFSGSICTNQVCVFPAGEGGTTTLDCTGKNPPKKPEKPITKVDLLFQDVLSKKGITTVQVSVCPNTTDPACTSPSQTARTDATGHVKLDLDTSAKAFDGYFDIIPVKEDGTPADPSGADPSAYVPSRIYYTAVPIWKDYSDYWDLLQFSAIPFFTAAFQETYDKMLGSAFLISDDCNGLEVPGYSFMVDATDPETHAFYLSNGTPSTTVSETDVSATGGFINLPVGARTFTMVDAQTKAKIGSLTAYVRPNALTYGKIGPSITP